MSLNNMGRSVLAALLALGLAASLVQATADPDLVKLYRAEKEAEGTEFLGDAELIVDKLLAWRHQQAPSQEPIKQLVYQQPFNQAQDVPFIMHELILRSQQDPEFRASPPTSENQLIRKYVVDSCRYYNYLFRDYFERAEAGDPRMESYSSQPEMADFYHDFAVHKVCEAMLQNWIQQL